MSCIRYNKSRSPSAILPSIILLRYIFIALLRAIKNLFYNFLPLISHLFFPLFLNVSKILKNTRILSTNLGFKKFLKDLKKSDYSKLPLPQNNSSHLQSWWRRSRFAASKVIIAKQRNQETNWGVVVFGRNGEVSSSLVPRLGPRRVRSYLREDLLFGKSFSRCQPAAGRTELTAHTPQFLFPLPLPSSTSGLRLVYLPSLTLLLANTLHSSSIRLACILLSVT